MVKTPEGELSTTAIRKLIRAHNVLMSIKIPAGSKREDIMKIITKNGYKVNHEKGSLDPVVKMKRKPTVTMEKAEKLLKKPPKTALQKQKAQEAKEAREEKKKKELRKIKKEVVEKVIDRKKLLKKKSVDKTKKPMKKEDEVRPKEKVGRPKVDPKKIKVIEPKKKEEPKKSFKFLDKDYDLNKLLDYIDKEGFKISKSQIDGLKILISKWGLSKMRIYYQINGELVLVPTLKFTAGEGADEGKIVDSEMASHFKKNTAIFKTILKPKKAMNYSIEEKKKMAQVRIKFLREEIETINKKIKVAEDNKKTTEVNQLKSQKESVEKKIKETEKLIDSNFKKKEITEVPDFKVGDLLVKGSEKKFKILSIYVYEVEKADTGIGNVYIVRRYRYSDIGKEWIKSNSTETIKIRKTKSGFNWKLANTLPNYDKVVPADWKQNIRQ